jgi:hypothetical protein
MLAGPGQQNYGLWPIPPPAMRSELLVFSWACGLPEIPLASNASRTEPGLLVQSDAREKVGIAVGLQLVWVKYVFSIVPVEQGRV